MWLRYTILAMVRNLIDWADDDFARGLPDTLKRVENRYKQARKLLGADELANECETIVLDISRVIEEFLGVKKTEAARYSRPLLEVRTTAVLKQAAKDIKKALQAPGSIKRKQAAVMRVVSKAANLDRKKHPSQSLATGWQSKHEKGMAFENAILLELDPKILFPPPMPQPRPVPDPKPVEGPGRPSLDRFPPSRPVDEPLDPPIAPPPAPMVSLEFCVPLNPELGVLRLRIGAQLDKRIHCLDFVGERQIPCVYGCDTNDIQTGRTKPVAVLEQYADSTDQSRYHYGFLVEKARQYTDVAQRLGALLLQALQNRDNEAFQQLKAEHAIELAGATVELRRLSQIEANDGVAASKLQSQRADSQVRFWEPRGGVNSVYDSLSPNEKAALEHATNAVDWQTAAAWSTALTALPAIAIGVMGAAGSAAGVVTAAAAAVGQSFTQFAGAMAARDTAISAQFQMTASYERRFEDWKNQFDLAKFDVRTAELQQMLAKDRAAIADQEMVIAQLQLSHAREELRFLQTKSSSLALYDWMVRVLSRDYRSLMQIAACVARMAQRALEFERQQAVQIIVGDYWNVAVGVLSSRDLTDEQRNLGLLGAERLLTDLTKLDAFKLATERRRQQLSKTISIARMMPTDLVTFRNTGRMTFNTLMEWFDDDVQGDYLRLIKNVRVTILAIVPPTDGIHATSTTRADQAL